jgi:pyruvate kinase
VTSFTSIESQKAPLHSETNDQNLAAKLRDLYAAIVSRSEKVRENFPVSGVDKEASRDNFLAYLALRENDLSKLQMSLADEGLSSLGRLEAHVLESIERVLSHMSVAPVETKLVKISGAVASSILADRSRTLLGRPRDGRRTRIMVTLDPATMYQPEMLEQLLLSGMDIARINCAHDTPREWGMLIGAIRTAEERLIQRDKGIGRSCRILMDVAGPKIRTGSLSLEVRPLKLSVPKDALGRTTKFYEGVLDCEAKLTEKLQLTGMMPTFTIAIKNQGSLAQIEVGERLRFQDARGRTRTLAVLERVTPSKVRVGLAKTAYLEEDLEISCESGGTLVTGPTKPQPVDLWVNAGDKLRLYRDPKRLGHVASKEEPAGISCTFPEALVSVKIGDQVFIDDGKIGAIVREINDDFITLEVASPEDSSASIKPEKGLNLPDSRIDLSALTPEDVKDLNFIVEHATAIGLSFVHRPSDIYDLSSALKKLGHEDLGIIAKIETKEAVHNLAEILLAGLTLPKFGVLIARGDLAVEVGFENLAFVQEDILCMCEAAHVPVIFATQVLETLAKSGLPSRAEITDAAMGTRAECVMLNKGPHIVEAVKTLSGLLSVEERHQMKKRQIFREFTEQYGIFGKSEKPRASA